MIERTLKISGQEVRFRSSATVPRLYRAKFKRDIFKDLNSLKAAYAKKTSSIIGRDGQDDAEIPIEDLEIFENVAYIMAYHADSGIPDTIDEWLDRFDMFSIYEVLPELLKLWGDNMATQVESKKNLLKQIEK